MRTPALALAGAVALAAACAIAADGGDAPRRYRIVTETVMPHLEDNLRYATRIEERCVGRDALATAFWMLGEASLRDCRLEAAGAEASADSARFVLRCTGGHGTTGGALWRYEPTRALGTLQVRLGGKNMTFSQRIVATPVGSCGR